MADASAELIKAIGQAGTLEEIRYAANEDLKKQQEAADADAAAKATAEKTAADEAAKKVAEEPEKVYSVIETINGRDFEFTAGSPEELTVAVLNARRVADAVRPEPAAQVQQTQETTRKTDAEIAAERTELELKFKRGELSINDYLEQSGAVSQYLASQGLSVEALKQTVEANENNAYVQSWTDAAAAFKQSPAGADWPGGNRNLKLLGTKLIELNLTDAEDKIQALAIAYNALKKDDMLFENEELKNAKTADTTTTTTTQTTAATTSQQTAAPVVQQQQQQARTASGVFGMSSGVPENTQQKTEQKNAPAQVNLDPKADPREIMEAWKASVVQNGQDPNAAFVGIFGGRKA